MKYKHTALLSFFVTVIMLSLVSLSVLIPKHIEQEASKPTVLSAQTNIADVYTPPVRNKLSGCVMHDSLPDAGCTPGTVFPLITSVQVCVSGYSKSVRSVPESVKRQVYVEYGITTHATGEYEVDHLISLELGGSNDIANLWPEPAEPQPGFHQKDIVENFLHRQVCDGVISLAEAQKVIATDWLDIFHQMRD